MPQISLANIQPTLDKLRIPSEFTKEEQLPDEDVVRLEQWKAASVTKLSELKDLLGDTQVFDVETAAALVYTVTPFNGDGNWVVDDARKLAQSMYTTDLNPIHV